MPKVKKKIEKREVPEYKKKAVKDLIDKIKKSRSVLIASTLGLPGSQFHAIKKKLRGKAEIKVVKKSIAIRALDGSGEQALHGLKEYVTSDVALFFADCDPFELSALLTDNQSPTKARAGDIALEDITIEPGPTDLVPGPAISELSGVGLKVAVEGGKLAIKQGNTVARKGEPIKENVASVLAKLNVLPMTVGFEAISAYDSKDKKVYVGIKIDKKKTVEKLKSLIGKALNFAINTKYPTKQTIGYFISRAVMEEKAIKVLIDSKQNSPTPATENVQTNDTNTMEGK